MRTKKNKFDCDVNGSIMVVAALRYALGRHTYVPGAVQDWITQHLDSLDTNTKTVVVRDVFEYLYDEYRKDVDENSPFDSPFGDYDIKTWEKFAIETYWKLDYSERKNVDQQMNNDKNRAIWFAEKLYGTQPV